MKISEVAGQGLLLMPAYVAVIDGTPKLNTSKFEFDGEHECGDCNGTGRMRRRPEACPSCNGRGTVRSIIPRKSTPILYYHSNRMNYLKQELGFKVTNGIIHREQISNIRRNILAFRNRDLSYLDQPEINRSRKPEIEIDGKTGLSTFIPKREYKKEVKKEQIIAIVDEFDRFLAAVQGIPGASIIIKDEF